MNKKRICLYLTEECIDTLHSKSKDLGISYSDFITILIKKGVTVDINKKT